MKKGATLKQAEKILSLFTETPMDQLQNILESGLLTDLRDGNFDGVNRNAFRQVIGLKPLNIYPLSVDYNRSIEEGIKAGKYDWFNNDITSSHFPSEETGIKEVPLDLIHFGKDKTTDEVLSELDKTGMRPVTLKELLALSEKHPDLQREFPIIALGSVWQDPGGGRCCADLDGSGSERGLGLCWVGGRWDDGCRFAAVRK